MSTPVSFSNNTPLRFSGQYKVLIADDQMVMRRVNERHVNQISEITALTGDTFTPTLVNNGPAALASLINADQAEPFDILLTDNNMGGLDDGIQLLNTIQTSAAIQNKPFAAMISSDGEPARIQAIAAGAKAFFDKESLDRDALKSFFQTFLATKASASTEASGKEEFDAKEEVGADAPASPNTAISRDAEPKANSGKAKVSNISNSNIEKK